MPQPGDTKAIAESCYQAALRGADWLEGQLDETGSFGPEAQDLAAYYKAPAAMHRAGRTRAAVRLLEHVRATYQQPDGDFLTRPGLKTDDPVLSQYPGYMNGWLTMGAHLSGRFDVSLRGWAFFRDYRDPSSGASVLEGPWSEGTTSPREMLMTAHLGLAALYLGELPVAMAAGEALLRFLEVQPAPTERLYLRVDGAGAPVTSFPAEAAFFHVVEASSAGQGWFFVGYPIAFLSLLYGATSDARHLEGARSYADFTLRCGERLTSEHFGHKVGWGAALLARATGLARYRILAEAVALNLLATQASDGGWLPTEPRVSRLDQSAEVIQWLLGISSLLDPADNG